jgi:hypothetical protein
MWYYPVGGHGVDPLALASLRFDAEILEFGSLLYQKG